jgi:hypothetical protein
MTVYSLIVLPLRLAVALVISVYGLLIAYLWLMVAFKGFW